MIKDFKKFSEWYNKSNDEIDQMKHKANKLEIEVTKNKQYFDNIIYNKLKEMRKYAIRENKNDILTINLPIEIDGEKYECLNITYDINYNEIDISAGEKYAWVCFIENNDNEINIDSIYEDYRKLYNYLISDNLNEFLEAKRMGLL